MATNQPGANGPDPGESTVTASADETLVAPFRSGPGEATIIAAATDLKPPDPVSVAAAAADRSGPGEATIIADVTDLTPPDPVSLAAAAADPSTPTVIATATGLPTLAGPTTTTTSTSRERVTTTVQRRRVYREQGWERRRGAWWLWPAAALTAAGLGSAGLTTWFNRSAEDRLRERVVESVGAAPGIDGLRVATRGNRVVLRGTAATEEAKAEAERIARLDGADPRVENELTVAEGPGTAPPAETTPKTEPPATEPPATEPPATDAPTTVPAPETTAAPVAEVTNLAAAAEADVELSSFANALGVATETDAALRAPGQYTVFAPRNAAFDALPDGTLDALVGDPAALGAVLRNHVVEGAVGVDALVPGVVKTVDGNDLTVTVDGDTIRVNGALVTTPPVEVDNGLLYVIDQVLVLPADEPADTTPAGPDDVVIGAAAQDDLSTFSSALDDAARVKEQLSGDGPFTVFAPSNDAFDAIKDDQLAAMIADPTVLSTLLGYHVVEGRLGSGEITSGTVRTIDGDTLNVEVDGDRITVNGSSVVRGPIETGNGLVYVLDRVLEAPGLVNAAGDFMSEDLTIYFDTAKANVREDQQSKILAAAQRLRFTTGGDVVVIGYADQRGNAAANLALSKRRAEAVVAALRKELGSRADDFTFTTGAEGDSKPQETLELSRRVTIAFTGG